MDLCPECASVGVVGTCITDAVLEVTKTKNGPLDSTTTASIF